VLFGAMMGMISSLLVFQLGQARVWFSMSRDGLLPKMFSRVHPRFRTPAATWIAGFLVGIPGGILDIGTLSDLSNIGTLFAFVLVSIGVIILRYKQPDRRRGFPRARRPGCADPQRDVLRTADGRPAHPDLAAILRVADHRDGRVLALQPPSQRVQPTELRAADGHQAVNSDFIASLPKAELHLHLEGTVDPPTLSELSRRHPTPLETTNNRYRNIEDSGRVFTEDEARELYQYKHFTGFMWAFKAVTERLRTADDYELVTYRMMQKLHAQNVLHAEVYISAGVVQWRGQDFAPLFAGAERGRHRGERDFGISLYWILDAVRHFGVDEAQRVVEEAIRLKSHNVVGIGIGGDERHAVPEQFREVYEYAAKHGLRLTVHAGETVGPESIWGALRELKADRIGHGLHAIDDPELVRHLADKQIPVEVCITSNVMTGCCARIEDHPVRKLFEAGVLVTLNTDDPDMFRTTLSREYQLAQEVFGFSEAELRELARNSFRASFLPEEKQRELLAMI
jgi:aminodeoxyfutalosine deaminase